MNILLFPNPNNAGSLESARIAISELASMGATPMLENELGEKIKADGCKLGKFSDLLSSCDILMPIGGDGTVMRAARHAVAQKKPLLAVNAGRLGFLAQVELDELSELKNLMNGQYKTTRRMLLEVSVIQGERIRKFTALNDIVIRRMDADGIVDIEVHEGEGLIARHRADGVIFATPTGSTAYSMSAGGPIVDPRMAVVLVTAICSHSTFNCSMVLPAGGEYTVTNTSTGNIPDLAVIVDGRRVNRLSAGQPLTIKRADAQVEFIELGLRSFYQSVNEKLSWGR